MRYQYYVDTRTEDGHTPIGIVVDSQEGVCWDCYQRYAGHDLRDVTHPSYNRIEIIYGPDDPSFKEVPYNEFLKWLGTYKDIPQRNEGEGVEYRCFITDDPDLTHVVLDVNSSKFFPINDAATAPWADELGIPLTERENPKRWIEEEGYREVSIDEFLKHLGL